MRRMALKNITLKDGTFIPKGHTVCVSAHSMTDPQIYHDPGNFDGYRFLKRAEDPAMTKTSNFVTPSPQHFGFGFGRLACPGRFFAGNEAKVLLSEILLKYEFHLEEGCSPQMHPSGFTHNVDHSAKLKVRRRKEEIDL
jgi:cytochrome P450